MRAHICWCTLSTCVVVKHFSFHPYINLQERKKAKKTEEELQASRLDSISFSWLFELLYTEVLLLLQLHLLVCVCVFFLQKLFFSLLFTADAKQPLFHFHFTWRLFSVLSFFPLYRHHAVHFNISTASRFLSFSFFLTLLLLLYIQCSLHTHSGKDP